MEEHRLRRGTPHTGVHGRNREVPQVCGNATRMQTRLLQPRGGTVSAGRPGPVPHSTCSTCQPRTCTGRRDNAPLPAAAGPRAGPRLLSDPGLAEPVQRRAAPGVLSKCAWTRLPVLPAGVVGTVTGHGTSVSMGGAEPPGSPSGRRPGASLQPLTCGSRNSPRPQPYPAPSSVNTPDLRFLPEVQKSLWLPGGGAGYPKETFRCPGPAPGLAHRATLPWRGSRSERGVLLTTWHH